MLSSPSLKIKLNNDADVFAFGQVAGLQNPRSVAAAVAAYGMMNCEDEENLEATIAKAILPHSYRGNPSLLASKVLAKLDGDWHDSSGFQTPGRGTHITIVMLRTPKPAHQRRTHANPSVKQLIKEWLDLNEPAYKKLKVPIASLPPFYAAHSEQLTYQIKREVDTPIKIVKLSKCWLISRK